MTSPADSATTAFPLIASLDLLLASTIVRSLTVSALALPLVVVGPALAARPTAVNQPLMRC